MKQLDIIRDFWRNLQGRTKKIMVGVMAALALFSVVTAVALNHKEYEVLFEGLNEEEASEVLAKLQESDVDYQYDQDGKVLVDKEKVDKTRATLAMDGYPKSGFSYDMFTGNAGLMSTESDKQTYKLYELQERIGSTIRTLDGIKSAVVTINLAESKKFVLDTEEGDVSTAYVVVNMEDGGSPEKAQVEGIQRLVAKAVPNMELGDVAVIDGNGMDVSAVKRETDPAEGDIDKKTEYEKRTEQQIESKVLNVLEPVYGRNNVKVAVKCTADLKRILSEEVNYSAPDTQNNSGYISHQTLSSEGEGNGQTASGIPGAQSNTNVTQYNTQAQAQAGYNTSSSDTSYELNQKKVQEQNDSAFLTDVSVAVTLNSNGRETQPLNKEEIVNVVAHAAGIGQDLRNQKIAVATADFYDHAQDAAAEGNAAGADAEAIAPADGILKLPAWILAVLAAILLVLILTTALIWKKKREQRKKQEEENAWKGMEPYLPEVEDEEEQRAAGHGIADMPEHEITIAEKIRDFIQENPELSSGLLKNWLRGGDDNE